MKKYPSIIFIMLILSVQIFSQQNSLLALTIPLELKENANAVIRNNIINVSIESIDEMTVSKKRVITILNKAGDNEVDTYINYNNDTKINKLSVKIYDAFGKELKKYSKNKFTDISAVDGGTLYSDARVKYIDYTPITYPYTVVFQSEHKTSSTGFIPAWFPLESYYVSIENSEYKINNPKNLEIRIKERSFKNFPIKKISESEIHYTMKNQPAINYERNSFSFIDLMPSLLVALNDFTLKGVKGKASNWSTFGKWMNDKLLSGRNKLDDVTILKAKSLVEGVDNEIEKAKILYNYMQDKTRYISVQVGIGGWEPIAAKEVDKVGYGDCKGLTNYTKALFDAVGIKSNYTVVYAKERRDIDSNFSSIQGNHVILNLPNKGADIWLECTSQTMPFGFLGDFTDDRNVLVVTPEGGKIKRTPAYKNETNLQVTKATIELKPNGDLTAKIKRISKGIQYGNKFNIESKPEEDLEKYYKSNVWNYVNNLEINSIDLNNDKENILFTEDLNVSVEKYASINQGDYLFRVNIFNKNNYIPKRYRTRNLPLKIERGYKDIDEFTITIPEGFTIGQLPGKTNLKTKFGEYDFSLEKVNETTLLYKKTILIKEGVYSKEDYKLYRSFRKKITKYENLRIALTKK